MAKKYQAFDSAAEAKGYAMLGFVQCIRGEEIKPYLKKHGLSNVDPEGWYPIQKWLDVLSDLAEERPGEAMFDFVAVGMKIMEVAQFPPQLDSMPFEQVFIALADDYRTAQHRGNVGEIVNELVEEGHMKGTIRTPYPDDYWYGLFYGTARRFLPPGTHFIVKYDEDTPRRDEGGDVTIIHITWET